MRSTLLLVLFFSLATTTWSQRDGETTDPEDLELLRFTRVWLPDDGQWFNTKYPYENWLAPDKLVILNFWNEKHVSAQQTITRLNEFQKSYPMLEAITVYLPENPEKFDESIISDLILEFDIRHKVYYRKNLDEVRLLRHVTAPTMIVVDDSGQKFQDIVGHFEVANGWNTVATVLESFLFNESFNRIRPGESLAVDQCPKSVFGKLSHIESAPKESQFFVSDIQRNKIYIVDKDGQVNRSIGSGTRGSRDGGFGTAQFDGPHGMYYDQDAQLLYVADTYNHVVREVNMKTSEVRTILGNGKISNGKETEVLSTTGSLSFPTDITMVNGVLLIAMAGTNQIWDYDLISKKAKLFAGNGEAGSAQGKWHSASFDNPVDIESGRDGDFYVVDARSGNIRHWTQPDGVTNLYVASNDSSGNALERPCGLLRDGDKLLIANKKSNQLCLLQDGKIVPVAGTGEEGWKDHKGSKATLNGPVNIDKLEGRYYVLDQGNDLIRIVNPKKFKVSTLQITAMNGLTQYEEAVTHGRKVYLPTVYLGDGTNTVDFSVDLGDQYQLLSVGRNDFYMQDDKGLNGVAADMMSTGRIIFDAVGDPDNPYIQFELYLTYVDKDKPEAIYYEAAFVLIPFEYKGGAEVTTEVFWNLPGEFLN